MEQSTENPDSVDFENPPLSEVVFSVQFEAEVIDEVVALSEFWPAIRDDFPRLEKHPPLPPATEQFEVQTAQEVQFQVLSAPPSQRYWFLSSDGTKLVQVQADRLLFNWRQVTGDEKYPRYRTLCPEFLNLLRIFLRTVSENSESVPAVAYCELAYINPIAAEGDIPGTHGQLARILNYLVKDPAREVLPPVEDTQLQQRFRITDEAGEPVGRFYVTAVSAFRPADLRPVYVVTLLARGRTAPEANNPDSLTGFLNRAHDLIVRGFREVTTDEMHRLWGLRGA